MRFMHTKLPDFYAKIKAAVKRLRPETEVSISGLENIKTAKLASLRVGRIEDEINDITEDERVKKVEVILTPENPEVMYTVVIKGILEDGTCEKAILENIKVAAPSMEMNLFDVKEIIDRRKNIKE